MFNEKQVEGLRTGKYWCDRCGSPMKFEDEKWRDVLVCTNPKCGYSTDLDHYGYTDEEYEDLYPTKEEVMELLGEEDGDGGDGETYSEMYED